MGVEPKILLWDIECSDFAADYGFIFCIGYKWLHEKRVRIIGVRDTSEFKKDVTDDRGVIREFAKVMAEADIQVTWYGEKFDERFINTRALLNSQEPMPVIPHWDGWKTAKFKLRFQSNRLDGVSRAIPVKPGAKRELKTYIEGRHWVRAKAGYTDALEYVEKHCIADIKVLENVYLALRPFSKPTANVAKIRHPELEGCPACGDKRLQARGYLVTSRGRKRRFQCQECAHWFTLPMQAATKTSTNLEVQPKGVKSEGTKPRPTKADSK